MRGETGNTVYINKERNQHGYSEGVYDKNGKLVTNSYNQPSFNYYLYETQPIKHFGYDILPWLILGNTRDDPTSFNERLFHYTLDLNIGIQTYIFDGSIENLEKINYDVLEEEDKLIYRFFKYILFNEQYKILLNENNKQKLKDNKEYYFDYFGQIQNILGVKQP
jgi:hypothetical protein